METLTHNPHYLGQAVLILFTFLGGYLLVLKLREHHRERPDPKLTYTTIPETDKLKNEIRTLQEHLHKHAEHLAALIAQQENTAHRISELTIKTDKILEKQKS